MPKTRVYVETTIPSFYHEARTEPDIVARRNWTRQWWDMSPGQYLRVTSAAVLDELAAGASEHVQARLSLVRDLPLLAVEVLKMKQKQSDPVVDEVRETRHQISARFQHDPAQLVAYYIDVQKQYQDRLVNGNTAIEREAGPRA